MLLKSYLSGIYSSEKKKMEYEGKVHFVLEKVTKENIGVKL